MPTLKKYIFFLFSLVILTSEFSYNALQTTDPVLFSSFQIDSESLVVGRLMRSAKDGIGSHGGFLGWNHPYVKTMRKDSIPIEARFAGWGYVVPGYPDKFLYQYEAYNHNLEVGHYEEYYSQSGGQSLIYLLIGKVFNITGDTLVAVCRFLNALFTALVISLFLAWGNRNIGLFASVFTLLVILVSQWLVVFADNMLYVTSLFYLPFVINLLYMHRASSQKNYVHGKALAFGFFAVLMKCCIAGFDFIIPTLVMSVLPLFYYSYVQKWPAKIWLLRTTSLSLILLVAVSIALLLLCFQLSLRYNSWEEALHYIVQTSERRTYGNQADLSGVYQEATQTSLWTVYYNYVNAYAFNLTNLANYVGLSGIRIKFGSVFSLFIIASFIAFLKQDNQRRLHGLLIITWVSMIGPIAWFIIFKYHSLTHIHMNLIIWNLPFMLLGSLLTGYIFRLLILDGIAYIKTKLATK